MATRPTVVHPPPEPVTRPGVWVRTARDICDAPEPEPSTYRLLGDLVTRGNRTLLFAPPSAGKSTIVTWWMSMLTRGGECLDQDVRKGHRVLYIDLEQGERSIRRKLARGGLADSLDVSVMSAPGGLALPVDEGDVAYLEDVLAGGWDVVVLDPWYKSHRGESNDERSMLDAMMMWDAWRTQYGFALVIVHHTRKAGRGDDGGLTLDDAVGSGALTRWPEVAVSVERTRQITNGALFTFHKDRDGELPVPETWLLEFFPGEGTYEVRRRGKRVKDTTEQAVREFMTGVAPGEWLRVSDITKGMGGKMANRTVQRIVATWSDAENPGRWLDVLTGKGAKRYRMLVEAGDVVEEYAGG